MDINYFSPHTFLFDFINKNLWKCWYFSVSFILMYSYIRKNIFSIYPRRKLQRLHFSLKFLSSSLYPLISTKTKASFNKAFHYVFQLSRGCESIVNASVKQKFIFNGSIYRNHKERCSFKRHCPCQKYISAGIIHCPQAHRQTMQLAGCRTDGNTGAVSCE